MGKKTKDQSRSRSPIKRKNMAAIDRYLFVRDYDHGQLICFLVLDNKFGGTHPRFICRGDNMPRFISRLSGYLEAPLVIDKSVPAQYREQIEFTSGPALDELPEGFSL